MMQCNQSSLPNTLQPTPWAWSLLSAMKSSIHVPMLMRRQVVSGLLIQQTLLHALNAWPRCWAMSTAADSGCACMRGTLRLPQPCQRMMVCPARMHTQPKGALHPEDPGEDHAFWASLESITSRRSTMPHQRAPKAYAGQGPSVTCG